MSYHPKYCTILYGISSLLDAVDGQAARALGQSSRFGAVLDMVTDRCVIKAVPPPPAPAQLPEAPLRYKRERESPLGMQIVVKNAATERKSVLMIASPSPPPRPVLFPDTGPFPHPQMRHDVFAVLPLLRLPTMGTPLPVPHHPRLLFPLHSYVQVSLGGSSLDAVGGVSRLSLSHVLGHVVCR